MNKDIGIMIALQKHWDAMNEYIADNQDMIRMCENRDAEYASLLKKIDNQKQSIFNLKKNISEYDLELAALNIRLKKLIERRDGISNDKELNAIDKEISQVEASVSIIEENDLQLMTSLEESEKEIASLVSEQSVMENEINNLKLKVKEKTFINDEKIANHRSLFDELMAGLSLLYKNKFEKLLNSKGGKAIAPVRSGICSNCNCKIPPHLALDVNSTEKVLSCTNCGRYIYS
jgi:predicted  nucleic acid-binding Zn-ribbon protein